MSDFLQSLVTRNGPTPESMIQPRLPSLFEIVEAANGPTTPVESNAERISAPQNTAIRNSEPEKDARLRPADSNAPQSAHRLESPATIQKIQLLKTDTESEFANRAAIATIRPPEVAIKSQETSPAPPPGQELAPRETHHPASESTPRPMRAEKDPERATQPASTIQPVVRSKDPENRPTVREQEQNGRAESDEHETTIHVHIGRIDVRAVATPAPAQPSAQRPQKARSTLSLDEYLKQRSEGKR